MWMPKPGEYVLTLFERLTFEQLPSTWWQDFDFILVERNQTRVWKPRVHEVAAGLLNANLSRLSKPRASLGIPLLLRNRVVRPRLKLL